MSNFTSWTYCSRVQHVFQSCWHLVQLIYFFFLSATWDFIHYAGIIRSWENSPRSRKSYKEWENRASKISCREPNINTVRAHHRSLRACPIFGTMENVWEELVLQYGEQLSLGKREEGAGVGGNSPCSFLAQWLRSLNSSFTSSQQQLQQQQRQQQHKKRKRLKCEIQYEKCEKLRNSLINK